MFDNKKIKELVLSSLVADAYCLGAHWIYDEKQLDELNVNWNELNDAKAIWHKGKKSGEFTHYGDQTLWLYNFIEEKNKFDLDEYIKYWKTKVDSYNGYIDGATRDTLENIKDGKSPIGSSSTDLSIVGRISPLLLISKTKEDFLENVETFVKVTHNSNEALSAASFFAKLLLEVLEDKPLIESILKLKEESNKTIQNYLNEGINSKDEDTFESIRKFGPACGINEGFSGVIHLLVKYDNLKKMLVNNAKAGGDSSARAMIASIIFMAQNSVNAKQIPESWLNIKAKIL